MLNYSDIDFFFFCWLKDWGEALGCSSKAPRRQDFPILVICNIIPYLYVLPSNHPILKEK